MPWAVAAAAVGVVGSAVVSKKNNKAAAALQDKQLAASQGQMDIANEQWKKYLETYAPLEDEIVSESRDYASEANKTKASQEAAGTVASSYANLRDRLRSTPGLDPSSDRYLKTVAKLGISEAANSAAAQTGARRAVEQEGQARKINALSLGKGLPASASAGLSSAGSSFGRAGGMYADQAGAEAANFSRATGDILGNKTFQKNVGSWFGGASNNQSYTDTNDLSGVNGSNSLDLWGKYGTGGD